MQTVGTILQFYQTQLTSISDTPRLDTEILLAAALKIPRANLLAYPERQLNSVEQQAFENLFTRRTKQEPIAYITGHQAFWSLDLSVNAATLIPRPETELLVEWLLLQLSAEESLRIADLGTGSGAIALALAIERKNWHIDATDISAAALKIATQNKAQYQLNNVAFYLGSWCQALPQKDYHAIVSNPPYIDEADPHLKALSFEPSSALIAAENGFADLQHIILCARDYLHPQGYLVLEHGYEQSDKVIKLLQQHGYNEATPHRDLAGHWRFASAKKA